MPLFWRHQTQASEACSPGSTPGKGLLRRLKARGGPHKADREGSIPSVATIEVWLNLVRAPRSGRGDCRFESGHLDHEIDMRQR